MTGYVLVPSYTSSSELFRQWLDRPDDTDFNGWNGVMKMDSSLGRAGFEELPNADQMLNTVLSYQNPDEGSFTAAGGCTNHNALHTLRQCSKRSDLMMWPEVFLAMERQMDYLERRWDPQTGLYRSPPGFDRPVDEFSTSVASSEAENVIGYCRILLRGENSERIAQESESGITPDRIRKLQVQATGLSELAVAKTKELAKAKHESKYGR